MANRHWLTGPEKDNWIYIWSPTLTDGVLTKNKEFKIRREVYVEFRNLVSKLENDGMLGWFTRTHIDRSTIMRWLKLMGAQPYKIDDKFNIWFMRRF